MPRRAQGSQKRSPRTWIKEARDNHGPSREQAKRIVEGRHGDRGPEERELRVQQLMARGGLAQEDLAVLIGVSQNEMSKIETGERLRIDPEVAEALGRELGMTREQVMFGVPQRRGTSILGKVHGDQPIIMSDEKKSFDLDGCIVNEHTEAYRIDVDSMEPRFRKGDVLLCRSNPPSLEECIGLECVVDLNGERYVRLVEKGASMRVVTLRPYRTTSPSFVDVQPTRCCPILAIIQSSQ